MMVYVYYALAIILEMLPISSSGSLKLLFKQGDVFSLNTDLMEIIDLLSHGVIAFVLVIFFYTRWRIFLYALLKKPSIIVRLCLKGFIVEFITVCFFIFFSWHTMLLPLFIGFLCTTTGLFSLLMLDRKKEMHRKWDVITSITLGCIQGLALLPGISRFASTYVVARWLGYTSRKSFELSFLIEWPISVAAFGLGLVKSYKLSVLPFCVYTFSMVSLAAACLAYGALCIVYSLLVRKKIWLFGWYTTLAALMSGI